MSENQDKTQTHTVSRRRFLFQMATTGASTALIAQSAVGATKLLTAVNI